MALLTHWRAPCCSPTATLRYSPTPCLPLLRTPILPLYGAPILLLLLLQGRPVSPLLPLHGGPPMLLLHGVLYLPCCRSMGRPCCCSGSCMRHVAMLLRLTGVLLLLLLRGVLWPC